MSNSEGTIRCTSCDRTFRWKPELAGRTVRCKCGIKLAIAKAPPVQHKPKAPPEAEQDYNPFADMFDDLTAAESAVETQPIGLQSLPEPALAKPPARRSMAGGAKQPSKNKSSSQGSLLFILFSFNGRISRSEYWLKGFPIIFIAAMLVQLPLMMMAKSADESSAQASPPSLPIVLGLIAVWLVLVWSSFAVLMKRWHDRDRSGWLLILMFIPLVNILFNLWMMIEVWFLKGTDGSNKYGPDPLDR